MMPVVADLFDPTALPSRALLRAANIDGDYRWWLTRSWDTNLPQLAVIMFNPSTADGEVDDPTICLLMKLASANGYGGIVVYNLIPLRSSNPAHAIDMVNTWDERQAWHERDALQENVAVILGAVRKGRDLLLAWGALADRCADWMENVLEEIECAIEGNARLLCLGKTAGGYPKHPLARGKHKVRPDQKFEVWSR